MMSRLRSHSLLASATTLAALAAMLPACASPFSTSNQEQLREQLISQHRALLRSAAGGGVMEVTRPPGDLAEGLSDQRLGELDQKSGPTAYSEADLELGSDLLGREESPRVSLSLEQAIRISVENNLAVAQARLLPAISDATLTQAEAVFDASFFLNVDYQTLDTPRPPVGFSPTFVNTVQSKRSTLTTGIRKPMTTGGVVTASTSFGRVWDDPSQFSVGSHETADVLVSLEQPLLRNFGVELNRSQIMLSQNQRRRSVSELRQTLLDLNSTVEATYWNLVLAKQNLLIRQRLLDRTINDHSIIVKRAQFDAQPVQLTESASFLELRKTDVIRARQTLRNVSDELKRLMNWDQLPVADETLIDPVDRPLDIPVQVSLLDAITTALRHRPEAKVALLDIDDATIRQRVADNQLLPVLNLAASVRYNGIGQTFEGAYDNLATGDHIDYLLSSQFQYPLGNREARALYEQRQLERQASVLTYQSTAQQIVLQVKQAMREMKSAYELIGATTSARRAAMDNLRAMQAQEDAGNALSPEFVNRKLDSQARVADAELQEMQALTDYNSAIANFYRTLGTLLEHNQIDFVDPASGR